MKTRFDKTIDWFKDHRYFSIFIILVFLFISIGQITDSYDKILRAFNVRKSLDTTSSRERTELTKEIIRNSWERVFWMRNYASKVCRGAPEHELEDSWNKVNAMTAKWSANLMIYYMGLKEYYPYTNKKNYLESEIHPLFESLTSDLADIKYSLSDSISSESARESACQFGSNVDVLNTKLYFFIKGIEKE